MNICMYCEMITTTSLVNIHRHMWLQLFMLWWELLRPTLFSCNVLSSVTSLVTFYCVPSFIVFISSFLPIFPHFFQAIKWVPTLYQELGKMWTDVQCSNAPFRVKDESPRKFRPAEISSDCPSFIWRHWSS